MRKSILAFLLCLPVAFAADFAGTWKMTAQTPNGDLPFNLVLEKQGEAYKGELRGGSSTFALDSIAAEGEKLKFVIKHEIGPIPVELTLTGSQLEGTGTTPDGANKIPMKGSRDQAAASTSTTAASAAVVPAGRWKIQTKTPDGNPITYTLEIKEDGGAFRGQLATPNDDIAPVTEIKLAGSLLSFKVPVDEGSFEVSMNIEGDSAKGSYKSPQGSKGDFTAARVK